MKRNKLKDYGAIYRSLATTQLEAVFNAEFINLDREAARLIVQDFTEAALEDGLTADRYLRRIGRGNLASYGKTMKARYTRGWN